MEKINLIVGDNFEDINRKVIEKIEVNSPKKNLVITPDSFSLNCEKLIFKTLKIKAYFNIEVMGITGLANLIIKDLGLEKDFVSKGESKLLIRKAIKNLNGQLKCFVGDISSGLVDLIFNSLSLFKSNEINAEQILLSAEDTSELQKNKLSDLSLILTEYNKLLNNKIDGTLRLDYLNALLPTYNLSKYNFYFVNFESLTKQNFTILKNITQTSNKVFIGAITIPNQKNSYIFENNIEQKILQLGHENNITIEVEEVKNNLSKNNLVLHQNLFAFQPSCEKTDFVKVFECDNNELEVLTCAREIKNLLYNKNARFKNISVACGNLKNYKDKIENIFSSFNFSYYLDYEEPLNENEVVNFMLNVLEWIKDEGSIIPIIKVFESDLSPLTKQEKNTLLCFIEKYNIRSDFIKDTEDENINLIKNKLTKNIEKLKLIKNNQKNIKNYLFLIKNIIKIFNLQEIIENKINFFKNNNYLKQEKIYIQVFPKIEKICNSLENIFLEEELEFNEFVEIFANAIAEESLSTVPLSTDCIFVGDANTSYFEHIDYLFVLGANENILPEYLRDTSIISDEIITKLDSKIKLSPTVKMINRRTKFKIFNLLKSAEKSLYITYSLLDESNKKLLPSLFIKDILKIFGNENLKIINGKISLNFLKNSNEEIAKDFAYLTGNLKYAKQEFLKTINRNAIQYPNLFSALSNLINFDEQKFLPLLKQEIKNKNDLYFKNSKTKISQIEKFYKCPFSHFMAYGVKLKDKELAELNTADIGNILHKVAEEFLKPENDYLNKINLQIIKINEINSKIIKKIEKNNIFYKINLKINKIAYKILQQESLRFITYLYNTSLKTKFKTKFLELDITEKNNIKINANNQTFLLVGKIDRVDFYNDYFNIIDYKTGTNTKGDNAELFYGDKIQLYVYARAIEKIFNKKLGGIFYFPISNEYIEDGDKNPYYLKGKNIFDEKYLSAMDNSLNFENPKSDMFACSIKINKKNVQAGLKEYAKKSTSETCEDLNAMLDYSFAMMKNALEEILEGNIEASPRENICEYCQYKSICQKPDAESSRKKIYKVTSQTFSKLLNKGEHNE